MFPCKTIKISQLFRLHATLPSGNPIGGSVADPPADLAAPGSLGDRPLRDLHGAGVRLRRPLRGRRRVGLVAQVHLATVVARSPHTSGNLTKSHFCCFVDSN